MIRPNCSLAVVLLLCLLVTGCELETENEPHPQARWDLTLKINGEVVTVDDLNADYDSYISHVGEDPRYVALLSDTITLEARLVTSDGSPYPALEGVDFDQYVTDEYVSIGPRAWSVTANAALLPEGVTWGGAGVSIPTVYVPRATEDFTPMEIESSGPTAFFFLVWDGEPISVEGTVGTEPVGPPSPGVHAINMTERDDLGFPWPFDADPVGSTTVDSRGYPVRVVSGSYSRAGLVHWIVMLMAWDGTGFTYDVVSRPWERAIDPRLVVDENDHIWVVYRAMPQGRFVVADRPSDGATWQRRTFHPPLALQSDVQGALIDELGWEEIDFGDPLHHQTRFGFALEPRIGGGLWFAVTHESREVWPHGPEEECTRFEGSVECNAPAGQPESNVDCQARLFLNEVTTDAFESHLVAYTSFDEVAFACPFVKAVFSTDTIRLLPQESAGNPPLVWSLFENVSGTFERNDGEWRSVSSSAPDLLELTSSLSESVGTHLLRAFSAIVQESWLWTPVDPEVPTGLARIHPNGWLDTDVVRVRAGETNVDGEPLVGLSSWTVANDTLYAFEAFGCCGSLRDREVYVPQFAVVPLPTGIRTAADGQDRGQWLRLSGEVDLDSNEPEGDPEPDAEVDRSYWAPYPPVVRADGSRVMLGLSPRGLLESDNALSGLACLSDCPARYQSNEPAVLLRSAGPGDPFEVVPLTESPGLHTWSLLEISEVDGALYAMGNSQGAAIGTRLQGDTLWRSADGGVTWGQYGQATDVGPLITSTISPDGVFAALFSNKNGANTADLQLLIDPDVSDGFLPTVRATVDVNIWSTAGNSLTWSATAWWLAAESASLSTDGESVSLSIAISEGRVTPVFHRMQFSLVDGELVEDLSVPEVLNIPRCGTHCPTIQGGVYHEDGDGLVFLSQEGELWNDTLVATLHHVDADTQEVTSTELGPVVPGLAQQFVELPDGRLLLMYTQRHVNGTDLDHTRAAYIESDDGGLTWDLAPQLIREHIGGNGQHFVTAVAEPDGNLLVTLVDNSAISSRTRPFDTLVVRFEP